MSIFTTIALIIVGYFAIGGLILGLIEYTFETVESVMFWPVLFIRWVAEIVVDLRLAFFECCEKWRS